MAGGKIVFLSIVILCVGLLGSFIFTSLRGQAPEIPSVLPILFNISQYTDSPMQEKILTEMLLWPTLVGIVHNKAENTTAWKHTKKLKTLQDCWTDPDWFRMYADTECILLWLQILEFTSVSEIDKILPVVTKKERDSGAVSKSQQNGGFRCTFQGTNKLIDVKGYWKPCRDTDLKTNSEDFAAEIVSFHIDHILAFYRTPAVVPRIFSHDQFQELGNRAENVDVEPDKEAYGKLLTMEFHCGRYNGQLTDGAMVGWTPKELQNLVSKRQKSEMITKFHTLSYGDVEELMETRFNIHQGSKRQDINWVLENVSVNLFVLLTNNFYRFDHNLFLQVGKNGGLGPFIFIDNDRARWKYDLQEKGRIPHPADHPLATFCKFPRDLVTRLKLLQAVQREGITLGMLVYLATSVYQDIPSGPIFTLQEARYLDSTVNYILEIIDICLDIYPPEEVLFDRMGRKEYKFSDILLNRISTLENEADLNELLSGIV